MAFSINEFKANVTGANSRSIAMSSHFDVVFTLPNKIDLSDRSKTAFNSLRWRAAAAELPGRAIQTTQYKPYGYGVTTKIGYDVIYTDVNFMFLCGSDMGEKSFFSAWQSSIVGNHSRNPNDTKPHQSLGYYNDYISNVMIIQYDQTGKVTYRIGLFEAYPIIVNPVPLAWNNIDINRLAVQFAYKHYVELDEPPMGRGARVGNRARLTINGIPSVDGILEEAGLPPIGDIFNIPIFNQTGYEITDSSNIKDVLGF